MKTYNGYIRDGRQVDSNRDNWEEFGYDVFKGTLNVKLRKEIKTKELDYDFTVWNKFGVKKSKMKVKGNLIDVFVGYKYYIGSISTLFIFAKDKLRDKYNLSNGETVEVIL